jgi:UMF1 family MFS transporter
VTAPGPRRTASLAAFCLYDFGNSAFTTIVVTVVYSVYFRNQVAGGGGAADMLWGLAAATAMTLVAVGAPLLGALSDRLGNRHVFLIASTLLAVAATAALTGVGRGDVASGFLLFVAGQVGYAVGEAFYNAFLPDVAPPGRIGLVSGAAWGIGYLGGLLSLGVAALFLGPAAGGADLPPAAYRGVWLAVAAQYLLFSAPALFLLRDRRGPSASGRSPLRRLWDTAREARRFRHVLVFLAAYFLYDNGLNVVIYFTAIYMVSTLHFTMAETLRIFALLQVTSFAGALAAGAWADRRGARNAIVVCLLLWLAVIGSMAAVQSRAAFTVVALAGGLGIGSTQACSRALLAHLVPAGKRAEMFGLFGFCTKASGSLGPALFGALSSASGDQRLALVSVLFFFGAGLILLARVDEGAGRRAAASWSDAAPASSS